MTLTFSLRSAVRSLFTYRGLFWVVLFMTIALRSLGLNRGMWIDELSSLTFAGKAGFWKTAVRYNNPPLYYLVLRGWMRLSDSEPIIRLLSVLFGAGGVWFTMECLRRQSKLGAILAGILFATLPELLKHGSEIRAYPLLVLSCSAVFFYGTRLCEDPRNRKAGLALIGAIAVGVLTQSLGFLLIPSTLSFLISWRLLRGGGVSLRTIVVFSGVGMLLALALAFWLAPHIGSRDWIPSTSWMNGAKLFLASLGVPTESLSAAGSLGFEQIAVFSPTQKLALAGLLSSVFLIVCLIPLGDWRRSGPYFVAYVVLWFQLVICSLFIKPILLDRTVLITLIPLLLFVSLQVSSLLPLLREAAAVCLLVLSLNSAVSWAGHGAFVAEENWKTVFATLSKAWRPGDVLILAPWWLGKEGVGSRHFPVSPADLLLIHRPGLDPMTEGARLSDYFKRKNESDPGFRAFLITRKIPDMWVRTLLDSALGVKSEQSEGGPVRLYVWHSTSRRALIQAKQE